MNNIDRFILVSGVGGAVTSSADGAAHIARWAGASDAAAAVVFFAMVALACPVYVGALRAYGRHGWRGER